MEIFLNKRAMRQVRLSVADAIADGQIDALREDLVSVFSDDNVEEIERRIDSGDFEVHRPRKRRLRRRRRRGRNRRRIDRRRVGRRSVGGRLGMCGTASGREPSHVET